MPVYNTRKMKLGHSLQFDLLSLAAGELYSNTVTTFWDTVKKDDIWLTSNEMQRLHIHNSLHSHTSDATVQSFFEALSSWYELRRTNPEAKPPHKLKKFYKVTYKESAIKIKKGNLELSNGRGNEPVVIPNWNYDSPKKAELGWDGQQYEIRFVYKIPSTEKRTEGSVAGADPGEVHIFVTHDGDKTNILNGRYLRSKRRYQNKLKAQLQSIISKKQKGSKRRAKLLKSKSKQLRKIQNQINEVIHKQTTALAYTLAKQGVKAVVIGDVGHIRDELDKGKFLNQKLHQWPFHKSEFNLSYKLERLGIFVDTTTEEYTSKTCPRCLHLNSCKSRNYKCKNCDFEWHRDGVGSVNIRRKYLGLGPVVGSMAFPLGIRYTHHGRIRPRTANSPCNSLESRPMDATQKDYGPLVQKTRRGIPSL